MNFNSHIIAIGRMKKSSPFYSAYEEYNKRLKGKVNLCELEGRNQKDELKKINSKLNLSAPIIVLDETGQTLSSVELSRQITNIQNIKTGTFQFIIGGADGFDDDMRKKADLVLSFGRLTWPHMLARVMLIEQIYRAQLILSGHPYHREG
jgi:23S rRNA (pseudouridine1915-N3)-methyltransferase